MGGIFSKAEVDKEKYRAKRGMSTKRLPNRWKYFDHGRQEMVGWYASQLFKTGLDLLISTKLSSFHDVRIMNALQSRVRRVARRQGKLLSEDGSTPEPHGSLNMEDNTKAMPNEYHYIFPFEDESVNIDPETHASTEKKDLWIDFVADTGDGFDPCYSVTYKQTRPTLDIKTETTTITTKRGSVLILGGDLCYPVPTAKDYDLRFKKLYEMAFPWAEKAVEGCEDLPYPHNPRCYAIPGNHDWYDTLTVFSALFLRGRSADSIISDPSEGGISALDLHKVATNDKAKLAKNPVWLGGYSLGQDQSYFALKLPKGWWMFGIDLGLYNDIDINQLRYFLGVAFSACSADSSENVNILIICHEPLWWASDFKKFPMNLNKLIKLCNQHGLPVRLWLAGDVHNYRRDSDVPRLHRSGSDLLSAYDSQFHKVICGGGGAFLHPTWVGKDQNAGHFDGLNKFELKKVYPSAAACYRLAFLNLFFPFYNKSFGLLTAGFYTMLLWWVHSETKDTFWEAFAQFQNPMPLGLACVYFSSGSAALKVLQGGLHFVAHLAGLYGLYGFARHLIKDISGRAIRSVITGSTYIIGGYVVGSCIMGIYLLVSALAGTHWNEAYSSFKHEGYKSFVRMHIAENGDLELYVIGIEKPNKKWEPSPTSADDYKGPLIRPSNPKDFEHNFIQLSLCDYYTLLGVSRYASQEEIRLAHKHKLNQVSVSGVFTSEDHQKEVKQRILKIEEAYKVLGDEETRKVYDQNNGILYHGLKDEL